MGISLEQINQGLLDTSKIITDGMRAWDNISGKTTPAAAQTTVAQAQPAAPAAATQQTVNQSPAGGSSLNLGSLPPWLLVVGAVGLFVVLKGKL